MIFSAFAALLVTAVGTAPLRSTRLHAARQVAITLASITMGTDPEHRVALAANPLPEGRLLLGGNSASVVLFAIKEAHRTAESAGARLVPALLRPHEMGRRLSRSEQRPSASELRKDAGLV